MPPKNNGPQTFVDTLGTFEGGVNTYPPPLLLAKNQLSSGLNTTLRKNFVTQRSVLRQIQFDATSQALLNSLIAAGIFQGGCYFQPDAGAEGLLCGIGGRLVSIFPNQDQRTATAVESVPNWVTGTNYTAGALVNYLGVYYYASQNIIPSNTIPPSDPTNWTVAPRSPQTQAWLWQSEEWVIYQDGFNNPTFINVDSTKIADPTLPSPDPYTAGIASRSIYGTLAHYHTQVTTAFQAPNPSVTTTVAGGVVVTDTTNMNVGDNIYFLTFGNMVVAQIIDGTHVQLTNVSIRGGTTIPSTGGMYWQHVAPGGLPPGRMGEYGEGRNWFSLIDGVQFVATDQVGGSSGSQSLNYRDAVLNITENSFLAGGGNFRIPGAGQKITAFRFTATLDASLGQGPLQVFTPNTVFSCQAPSDRLTWQDITNPILTESLINNGAIGQNPTINVNGDLTFRSIDGLRSLILARRDIDVWGNVPISREVQTLLDSDNQTLLNWGSAIVFDNRLLFTATPSQITQGVIHQAIVPLNLDPLSSLRGKEPSIYDSERWTGLNVFQLFVGTFADLTRAFAVCWNTVTNNVELYEILRTSDSTYLDNDVTRIVWSFNTASLFKESMKVYKRLIDGEIYVDELQGLVDFQIWFRPDQHPCFVPWIAWQECQTQPTVGTQPGFRPRMGLGAPPVGPCDPVNNRPLAEFFTLQIRGIITGKVRFLGGQFKAVEADQPEFATPQCVQSCGP